MKAALRYREISRLCQVLFYMTTSAIVQEFRDNEKKTIKNYRQLAILDFISAKFVMGCPCVSPYILFYMHVPAFLLCFWVT